MAEKNKTQKKSNYVVISNKMYGKDLLGTKIFYEGERPKILRENGSFRLGKNILEFIKNHLSSFKFIITPNETRIVKSGDHYEVKISLKTISKLRSRSIEACRDINNEVIEHELEPYFPSNVKTKKNNYYPGKIGAILTPDVIDSLNLKDKEALDKFIPAYLEKAGAPFLAGLKAKTQISTLKQLSKEINKNIKAERTEFWWQSFIKKNILVIQQGYISFIEKLNLSLGDTKYPDFLLITHDSYIEVMEIKKPQTSLLKLDRGRNNYYWDTEISKAIIQVENYIDLLSKNSDSIRNYIKDAYKMDIRIVRPRGIVLAGTTNQLTAPKSKDDFRLLTQANKNVSFLTYDELAVRLDNYISVLESYNKRT